VLVRVFISWSGEQSRQMAVALADWLPSVIQATEPWLSFQDIEKGARWAPEIRAKLAESRVGIFCLTRHNLSAPWLLFEAGAISNNEESRVCTLLLGLEPTDIAGPLDQFQHTLMPTKVDLWKLVSDVNEVAAKVESRSVKAEYLRASFEALWPNLDKSIQDALAYAPRSTTPLRTERDILTELLETVRVIHQRTSDREEIARMADEAFAAAIARRPGVFADPKFGIWLDSETRRRSSGSVAHQDSTGAGTTPALSVLINEGLKDSAAGGASGVTGPAPPHAPGSGSPGPSKK
jgi:hypothetical protein